MKEVMYIMARNPLRNVAYKYLYDNIISNKLSPGQVIVEQEISNKLGISRTPIREALKQLTAEKLVRHIPARGTFVEDITVLDVQELFEIREMFEEAALKTAINKIPEEEIDVLIQEVNSLNNDISQPEEFYKRDRKIHNMILKNGHNKRMIELMDSINVQLERVRRISAMTAKRLEKSKQEHLEVLYAIKERDIEKAVNILHSHLENVKRSTMDVCERARFNS